LQAVLNEMDELGATLVALTPQMPEHNQAMRDKNALNFHLLSDSGNAYAAALGLRFAIPPDLKAEYQQMGLTLPKYNGDESWTLPVPARLVIDTMGIVRAADVDADYTRRPEPEKTIADLRAIALDEINPTREEPDAGR
jgi:peroxiredoxin